MIEVTILQTMINVSAYLDILECPYLLQKGSNLCSNQSFLSSTPISSYTQHHVQSYTGDPNDL
jgi:hypothetical protein